ncbi:MAG: hypothetical protein WC869_11850 [Phycisphaerae bacterium]|jgi:hypothetical protein
MQTSNTYCVPKGFITDHRERDLPTPRVVQETTWAYCIRRDDPALPELLDDARYYAHPDGPDMAPGIRRAAKSLLAAIAKADGRS